MAGFKTPRQFTRNDTTDIQASNIEQNLYQISLATGIIDARAFGGLDDVNVGPTKEQMITAAIQYAVGVGATAVFVPKSMRPYTASLVTFNSAIVMVDENFDFNTINVQAYGAVGNGVIDDAAAINAANTYASLINGTVIFPIPSVQYLCLSAITRPANVEWRGSGKKYCKLFFSGATNGVNITPAGTNTPTAPIRDMSILGNYGTSLIGLNISGVSTLILDNVEIYGFTTHNLKAIDFVQLHIRKCLFLGGGSVTTPNCLFDANILSMSDGLFWEQSYLSGGLVSFVGVRIERCVSVRMTGALESAGTLIQVAATRDYIDGRSCENVDLRGLNLERAEWDLVGVKQVGKYIEAGTAFTGSTYACYALTVGSPVTATSGSLNTPIGMAFKAVNGLKVLNPYIVLTNPGTAGVDILAGCLNIEIEPNTAGIPALNGGVYVRSGGSASQAGANDIHTDQGAVSSRDLNYNGGYRQSIDGWYQNAVAANQNNVVLARLATATEVPTRWIAPRAGSITCVWVKSDSPRSAGTLTMFVFKNNASVGFSAVLDGTNTTFKATTAVKDAVTFVAGDEIDVRVNTDAGWLPTTANIRAGIDIET